MSTESATGLTPLDTARATRGSPSPSSPATGRSVCCALDALAALPERPPVIVVDNSRDDGTRTAVRGHPAVAGLAAPPPTPVLWAATWPSGTPAPRTSPSATTTPGGSRAASPAPPTSSTATPGWACSPPAPWSATRPPTTRSTPSSPTRPCHRSPTCPAVRCSASSAGLWLGGEEGLLACDLLRQGWWLAYAEDLTVHHQASRLRDSTARRVLGIRNTLWFTWLRRPLLPALRRTGHLMRTVPRDFASVRAFAHATAGLPWVLRQRDPVPPDLERRLAELERARRTSPARRCVG
jgi:hypothetical protein